MKGTMLPVEPFRRILRSKLEQYEREHDATTATERLSIETGIPPRGIYRILEEQKHVGFDAADRIVTRLRGPMAWHTDEELHEIYMSADMKSVDWITPTSDIVHQRHLAEVTEIFATEGSVSGAARVIGFSAEFTGSLLLEAGVDTTPHRNLFCPQGHEKKVVGAYKDGTCKLCAIERNRAWREKENPDRKTRRLRSAVVGAS